MGNKCRSQWPRGLRRRSAASRLLRLCVRIPPGAWMFVCCECCVLSGRGLCEGLITRPEESYRLWCVVVCDLEKPQEWGGHGQRLGCKRHKKMGNKYGFNFYKGYYNASQSTQSVGIWTGFLESTSEAPQPVSTCLGSNSNNWRWFHFNEWILYASRVTSRIVRSSLGI